MIIEPIQKATHYNLCCDEDNCRNLATHDVKLGRFRMVKVCSDCLISFYNLIEKSMMKDETK